MLFDLKEKEAIAEELTNILDDYISSIAVRLEREFILTDFDTKEFVASDCFMTAPPAKGEFYITSKAIYEVLQVTHSYKPSTEAGTIQVRKVRELKTAG